MTPEHRKALIQKWKPVLDINESRSDEYTRENMAILLESQSTVQRRFKENSIKKS